MASSQLQGLIREAFEAGMQEARAHIHPPAQPIDVPVPNASAVQTAATPTTVVLTTTPPSTQFTATTVTANMSSAPSTTMAIGEGIFPANSLAFHDDVETDTDNSRHFVSQSLPLHLMVSDIVRQKILANKFVDMSTLTDKDTDGNMTMVINTNDDKPSFQLVRKSGPPKTLSIDEWTNHFNIFIAVFCSIDANKEVFPKLLKYMSMVRHLAAKHADWRYYDKTFRMLMANPACHLRWDECQMELWQEAMSRRANLSQNTNVCHRYARGEYCSGCKFLHKCGVCGAKHASSNCPVLGYQGNQGSSTHGNFRPPHFRFRGPRFGQRFNNPSNYRFPYRGNARGHQWRFGQ